MGHRDWKSLDRNVIYEAKTPDEISFIREKIILPSGHEFDYVYVDCPYQVVYVVGIDGQDNVLLIKQYRYLINEHVVEVPAGSPDGGESLEDGARREFEEESGYQAEKILLLGTFYPSSGITNQKGHIYLALNLKKTNQKLEIGEDIEIKWKPLAEAVKMVYQGKIQNVGAAYGILLANNWQIENKT